MADDWEQEDWEAEDFKPQLPAGGAAAGAAAAAAAAAAEELTAGQALLAKVTEPDMSKFADEDQEEPEEETSYHIKPQPKKKVEKRYGAGRGDVIDDTPLDDPEAEKLRRQRLEEEADFRATNDLFGGERAAAIKQLDVALPKTVKDFEDLAERLAKLFVLPHATNKNYKVFLKTLVKLSSDPISAEDAKELENTTGTIRADKVKAEKAAAAAKKGAKKSVNVGKAGGTAGLDDYIYDAPEEDEFDFM